MNNFTNFLKINKNICNKSIASYFENCMYLAYTGCYSLINDTYHLYGVSLKIPLMASDKLAYLVFLLCKTSESLLNISWKISWLLAVHLRQGIRAKDFPCVMKKIKPLHL